MTIIDRTPDSQKATKIDPCYNQELLIALKCLEWFDYIQENKLLEEAWGEIHSSFMGSSLKNETCAFVDKLFSNEQKLLDDSIDWKKSELRNLMKETSIMDDDVKRPYLIWPVNNAKPSVKWHDAVDRFMSMQFEDDWKACKNFFS